MSGITSPIPTGGVAVQIVISAAVAMMIQGLLFTTLGPGLEIGLAKDRAEIVAGFRAC